MSSANGRVISVGLNELKYVIFGNECKGVMVEGCSPYNRIYV